MVREAENEIILDSGRLDVRDGQALRPLIRRHRRRIVAEAGAHKTPRAALEPAGVMAS
jgi:hypothetical protein